MSARERERERLQAQETRSDIVVESKAMQRSRGGMVEREEKSDCDEEDMKLR